MPPGPPWRRLTACKAKAVLYPRLVDRMTSPGQEQDRKQPLFLGTCSPQGLLCHGGSCTASASKQPPRCQREHGQPGGFGVCTVHCPRAPGPSDAWCRRPRVCLPQMLSSGETSPPTPVHGQEGTGALDPSDTMELGSAVCPSSASVRQSAYGRLCSPPGHNAELST